MNKKKKIIFVTSAMVLGGIEKSLLDLLILLPRDIFDISLILEHKKGELLQYIPEDVKIYEMPFSKIDHYELEHGRVPAFLYALKTFRLVYVFRTLFTRFLWLIKGRKCSFNYPAFDAILQRTPYVFNEPFDIAVAYWGDYIWSTNITLTYLKAKKKICWTHSELPYAQSNKYLHELYYSKFDYRFACSQATADKINSAIGQNITKFIPHVINTEHIKEMAKRYSACERSVSIPIVLTVARLNEQKGIDIALEVHKKLLQENIIHHWYIVGNGHSRENDDNYRKMVKDADMEQTFFLEGGKSNPYPYFEVCDVYVQPSRFEGYCITVAEARTFKKPIVATDFYGAQEQLKNGETGFIVPCDVDRIADALKQLLLSTDLRNKFKENLALENADTRDSVIKIWCDL